MKVAIVHDWLTGMRGGEKVLLEFVRMLPSADVFTLVWNRGTVVPEIERRVRSVSFLDRLPGARTRYRYYLPLFPAAVRSLNLSGYDVILSSSHAVAKGVRIPSGAVHVSYVHTPMRYIWDTRDDSFRIGPGRRWKRAAVSALTPYLRRFDRRTSAAVDYFLANSQTVRDRIRRCYGAEAEVLYPPVDADFFTSLGNSEPGGYYLFVSSIEPYKRVDIAIDAFTGGKRRLVIVGSGSLAAWIQRRVRPPIEYLGRVSDTRLRDLYRGCRALVFPGREDFGLAPVEAQACGRPVICFGEGGATESVIDGVTGIHFRPQTAHSLREAVELFETGTWNPATIRHHSLRFSTQKFRRQFAEFWLAHFPESLDLNEHIDRDACGASH